ncbi:hypothetical protein G3545_08500 [Starkeya sp. ORNL1]|uniref:hypothetical protein n=1 Tax=Starkeya sp. ORNL1 TaxID=2709380 RepID=UPI00146339A9|nr:hypothetical protein [Starkeya sp. ORNL1]QJP13692.1 hypothetical protein G3545_08500 [Starkeya sp. ORNL1]
MAPNIPSLPPPSAPLTVPATGLIHEEWYLWLKRINPLLQAAQSALQGLPDDLLHAGTGAELSVGFTQADFDNGAVGAGSFTPDPANGALQRLTVTGAFTLTPPADTCAMALRVVNGTGAGAIDVSGFEGLAGAEHDTVVGNKFWFGITVIGGDAVLSIVADAANT